MSTLRNLIAKHEETILRGAWAEYNAQAIAECARHGLIYRDEDSFLRRRGYAETCFACVIEAQCQQTAKTST